MLFVILGLKETFAGLGIGLGLFILIRYRKLAKVDLLTIAISIVWGLVAIKFIIPHFSEGVYLYAPLSLPTSIGVFLKELLGPRENWQTIFYTYLTFGFLPTWDLSVLPAILENFVERFVLSPTKAHGLLLHYNAPLSPLMFIGALVPFVALEKSKKFIKIVPIYSVAIILVVLFLHRKTLNGPLGLFYNGAFYEQNQRVKYVDDFVSHFPKSGKIMTQNDLATRLTHQDVYLLRENYKSIDPDSIILNLTPGQNPNSVFPLNLEQALKLKANLISDSSYKVEKFGQELYIFTKK